MSDRQRRRFTWPRIVVAALVVGDSAAGWWLHQHNHLDLKAALVVVCVFLGTLVTVAALVICCQIASSHELTRSHQARLRELEAAADNVVPIRRDAIDEDTILMPTVVVGRAAPVAGGSTMVRPQRRLTYTAGDHTIDCFVREVLEQEGDAG